MGHGSREGGRETHLVERPLLEGLGRLHRLGGLRGVGRLGEGRARRRLRRLRRRLRLGVLGRGGSLRLVGCLSRLCCHLLRRRLRCVPGGLRRRRLSDPASYPGRPAASDREPLDSNYLIY